jgi:MATE family multidrug resistance protein
MLVLLSGLLPNPQLSISTMAITANMHDICYLMTAGLGSATSTRVAQSLGGGKPSTARLTVLVRATLSDSLQWAAWLSQIAQAELIM